MTRRAGRLLAAALAAAVAVVGAGAIGRGHPAGPAPTVPASGEVAEASIVAEQVAVEPAGPDAVAAPVAPPQPAAAAAPGSPGGTPVAAAPVERAAARPPVPVPDRVRGREGEPVWLLVPDVGVSAPVLPVGVDTAGRLDVPDDPADVGWWADGALLPGVPQVLVGHVDSRSGPGVFAALDRVAVGQSVVVVDGDGSRTSYRVQALRRVSKTAFPTAAVYGARDDATVQLITCTGTFDRATGHYRDNLIVTATLTGQ